MLPHTSSTTDALKPSANSSMRTSWYVARMHDVHHQLRKGAASLAEQLGECGGADA
jgi:hypothetical protein